MTDFINFWLAKAYVDLLIGLGVFGFMVAALIVVWVVQGLRSK